MYSSTRIEGVIDTVTKCFGITRDELFSKSNKHEICVVRYILYLYLHKEVKLSSSKLGEIFRRDRINILRGIRVFKGWMRYCADIKAKYDSAVIVLKENGL